MKTVLSLSGGIDSTTVLAWLLNKGHEVLGVSFSYGSKHNQYENKSAKDIAEHYDIPFHPIDISGVMKGFKSNLLQDGGDIPEGHYTDKSMLKTVVPGRNIIFLSILAGYAWSNEAEQIAIGIHQGDHAIYADCRVEFFKAMEEAIHQGTDGNVSIIAPFVNHDKRAIIEYGLQHNVPYELTRTCYKDQPIACGKCGSCVERREAFALNNTTDKIRYYE